MTVLLPYLESWSIIVDPESYIKCGLIQVKIL